MNGNCLDKEGNFKKCPYRVFTESYPAILRGSGDCVTQEFYSCMGEACIAYHVGICLRAAEALKEVK